MTWPGFLQRGCTNGRLICRVQVDNMTQVHAIELVSLTYLRVMVKGCSVSLQVHAIKLVFFDIPSSHGNMAQCIIASTRHHVGFFGIPSSHGNGVRCIMAKLKE